MMMIKVIFCNHSSVSSALNALPCIIIEDCVKPLKPGLSDVRLGYISKIISLVGGLISFSLIFIVAAVGNILPVRNATIQRLINSY